MAVSPDGNELASASADATVRRLGRRQPAPPAALQSPSVLTYGGDVECLAFSPDGRRLVSGHDDNALRVWELPSGRLLHVLKGHSRRITCVAFSPDGRTIASGGEDRSVRLWDAATGQPRLTFTGHTDELGAVVFTPDGKTVISGGHDRTIQAWDPDERGRPVRPSRPLRSRFTTWRSAPTAAPSLRPVTTRRASSGTSPTGGLA